MLDVQHRVQVGSRTISKLPGMNLSPASIRNVMQDLEERGLLSHPHTSAGRIPTESGLRLFVDGMMQAAEPSAEERAAIEARLERAAGRSRRRSATPTAALSGLSACAGIVLVPKREPVLKQLGFVQLSPTQALAVMVGGDGTRREPGGRPAARRHPARWPRSAITSARACPA
jgi:heat-inducible transcriptional repressor